MALAMIIRFDQARGVGQRSLLIFTGTLTPPLAYRMGRNSEGAGRKRTNAHESGGP